MAKTVSGKLLVSKIIKRTKQGGKVKRSSMNKSEKRAYKAYRGQGK
jgi:hypothetical protein